MVRGASIHNRLQQCIASRSHNVRARGCEDCASQQGSDLEAAAAGLNHRVAVQVPEREAER